MSQVIRLHAHGGPEQLRLEEIEVREPKRGEVQIRQTAIGLNFIDVYDRTGLYPVALPAVLGREAAGVIAAVPAGEKKLALGMRVAYTDTQPGAYAGIRNVPVDRLVRVPDDISDDIAAAVMLKGLTAHYLLRSTWRVKRGDAVLVHAAAGGVGLILVQWARALGARVIAVVGSEPKAALVRKHGCEQVLVTEPSELAAQVKSLTGGRGVRVVYDAVGKDTFFASMDCLAPLGLMVSYGNASGPVPPIAPLELSRRGSLFLTRPTLIHYIATPAARQKRARELFDVIRSGAVQISIGQRYALADAAQAHRDLEARRTTGSTVLIP